MTSLMGFAAAVAVLIVCRWRPAVAAADLAARIWWVSPFLMTLLYTAIALALGAVVWPARSRQGDGIARDWTGAVAPAHQAPPPRDPAVEDVAVDDEGLHRWQVARRRAAEALAPNVTRLDEHREQRRPGRRRAA